MIELNTPLTSPQENSYQPAGRSRWPGWMAGLERWGLTPMAALLLESAGPLNLFLAQMVYLGQPWLATFAGDGQVVALARLLENQEEAQAFAAFLREEETR